MMNIEELLQEEIPLQLGEDDLKEQLNILVSSGRAKEMVGKNLTHDDVRKLSEEDVKKLSKRYEAALAAKTTDAVADSAIKLATKLLGFALPIDDIEALQKDLQNDYLICNELKIKAGWLSLKCGSLMAVASAGLHIAQHIKLEELTMSWKDFKKSRTETVRPDKEPLITLNLNEVPVPGTVIGSYYIWHQLKMKFRSKYLISQNKFLRKYLRKFLISRLSPQPKRSPSLRTQAEWLRGEGLLR